MLKNENTKLPSYRIPIIMIFGAVLLYFAIFAIDDFFDFSEGFLRNLYFSVMGAICISTLLFNLFELGNVLDKRNLAKLKRTKKEELRFVKIPLEEILHLCESNDILRIVITTDSGIVKTGSASDLNRRTGKFFDKVYYIDDDNFNTIEQYSQTLTERIHGDRYLSVITIEDLPPTEFNRKYLNNL